MGGPGSAKSKPTDGKPAGRHPGGRPSFLTPDRVDTIVKMLTAGNYLDAAAAMAGVDRSTVYQWLKKGANQQSGVYHDFHARVEQAQAEAECRLVSQIAAAAKNQWQAAAWHLERKFPDRWGRKERLDVTVDSAADKAQTTAAILAGFFGAKEDEADADAASGTPAKESADGGPDAPAGA